VSTNLSVLAFSNLPKASQTELYLIHGRIVRDWQRTIGVCLL
jgi:hypothetical protein